MPAQKLQLDFKGLVTAPGQLGAPAGSLTVAQNVDFPAPGLAEKRIGIESTTYGFGGAAWSVVTSKALGDNLLFNVGDNTGGLTLQYGTGDAVRTSAPTPDATNFTNPPTARMRGAVSLANHYLTSSRAPGRLESDYTLHFAGMPRAPGFYGPPQYSAALFGGVTNFLPVNYAVAYRCVWVRKDADGVEMVSAPSGRWVIANIATTNGYTGAARDTALRVIIPRVSDTTATAITTAWKLRVYRSIATAVATSQPNDEMQLCYEASPTAGEIAAGVMLISDQCPEATLGAFLYTNTVSGGDVSSGIVRSGSTSLGLLAANDRPPLAKDVASFANCLWWANFTTLQRTTVSILAVGAVAGTLQVGDVITVAGTALTGVAGLPGANQFTVELGLGSVTLNIRQTAINLVSAINLWCTTVCASYTGSDASPGTIGRILVEARRSDAAAFNISTSGSATPFLPPLTGGLTSTQDEWNNGLAISKPFQGDAVPPANYLRVGRNDTSILKLMPLRDALFIFSDDGISWARGDSPATFTIESFDSTFRLAARDAVVACGDAIYAWGMEGIARITNGGVEYLDLPIRNYVQQAIRGVDGPVTSFSSRAFAVAYRIARRVLFFFPGGVEDGDYACVRALVFNISTSSWATYLFDSKNGGTTNGKLCGVVRWNDELLHLGEWSAGTDTLLYRDRSAGSAGDYTDTGSDGLDISIQTLLEWTSSAPNPAGLCHWSEAQVFLSPSDVEAAKGLPASVGATVTAEHGGATSANLAPTTVQCRMLMGAANGFAARQVMAVSHTTKDEYCSFSGFALLYHPVSVFTTR